MSEQPATAPIAQFPVARFHLRGIVERRLNFPDFAGSALRGAFGHALRRMACATGQTHCPACPLYQNCDYPAIFETPPPAQARRTYTNIPQPYVIEPPAPGPLNRSAGETFDFSLVLIGPALKRRELIIAAFRQALVNLGHGQVRLEQVTAETDPANTPASHIQIPPPPATLQQITLNLCTPFLMARNGKAITATELSARDILMAMLRRTADLTELQLQKNLSADFSQLAKLASTITMQVQLQPLGFSRRSARQNRSMPMFGHIGTITLHGNLTPFWPYLYLCQWLHIGKKCVFGFGRYTLSTPVLPEY